MHNIGDHGGRILSKVLLLQTFSEGHARRRVRGSDPLFTRRSPARRRALGVLFDRDSIQNPNVSESMSALTSRAHGGPPRASKSQLPWTREWNAAQTGPMGQLGPEPVSGERPRGCHHTCRDTGVVGGDYVWSATNCGPASQDGLGNKRGPWTWYLAASL